MEVIKRRKLNEVSETSKKISKRPLRVLLIASQPLLDDDTNDNTPLHLPDLKEERAKLAQIFVNAGIATELHVLPEANYSDLLLALQQPWDIIHYTGHGAEEDGSLLLEDGFAKAYHLKKEQLSKIMANTSVSIVFLSACYSEHIAYLLQNSEPRGVVAIKSAYPIAQDAAVVFAEAFYKTLAQGLTAGSAFNIAQNSLEAHPFYSRPDIEYIDKSSETDFSNVPYAERFLFVGDKEIKLRSTIKGSCIIAGGPDHKLGNLRPLKSTFIGREQEITHIVRAFEKEKNTHICLWGTAGIGKTELAVSVARWFGERSRLDAVLFASANPCEDEGLVTDLITMLFHAIKVFQLPIGEGTQLDAIKKAVIKFFTSRRALIVMDAWEGVASKQELWTFLRSLQVKVLITSRAPLSPAEVHNIEVTPLSSLHSRRLFWNVIKNSGYFQHRSTLDNIEISILKDIGDVLGGMPLAIEMAATQTSRMTLHELWNQLSTSPEQVLETRNEITGQTKGVWTSLALSFRLLHPTDQIVLVQLSIFNQPVSLIDAYHIVRFPFENFSPQHLMETIHRLMSHSFVRLEEGGNISMYPVVRQFLQSYAKSEQLIDLHYRAVKNFVLRGELQSALSASDHLYTLYKNFGIEEAGKLFLLYYSAHYEEWFTQGKWYKTMAIAMKASEISKNLRHANWMHYTSTTAGELYTKVGEIAEALKIFSAGLKVATDNNDPFHISVFQYYLGIIYWTQGNVQEAKRRFEESVAIGKSNNFLKRVAEGTSFLGILAEGAAKWDEAKKLHQESIQLKESLLAYDTKLKEHYDYVRHLLSDISDKLPAIEQHFHSCFDVIWNTGIWRSIIDSVGRLAAVEIAIGNRPKALEYIEYALKLAQQRKYSMGIFILMSRLGMIKASEQKYDEAVAIYNDVLAQVKNIGSSWQYVETALQLSSVYSGLQQRDQARELLTEILEMSEQLGFKRGVLEALNQLSKLDFDEQNYEDAMELYEECLKLKDILTKADEAMLLNQLATCHCQMKNVSDALPLYEKSLQLYKELHDAKQVEALEKTISSLQPVGPV